MVHCVCRYYLWFTGDLQTVLDSWKIGMTGVAAYRAQTCGRSLVSLYSYLWATMVVFEFLWSPAIFIIQAAISSFMVLPHPQLCSTERAREPSSEREMQQARAT